MGTGRVYVVTDYPGGLEQVSDSNPFPVKIISTVNPNPYDYYYSIVLEDVGAVWASVTPDYTLNTITIVNLDKEDIEIKLNDSDNDIITLYDKNYFIEMDQEVTEIFYRAAATSNKFTILGEGYK